MPNNEHYTAHVKITHTTPAKTDNYGKATQSRSVTDVTEITVRDDSYTGLVQRLTAMVQEGR